MQPTKNSSTVSVPSVPNDSSNSKLPAPPLPRQQVIEAFCDLVGKGIQAWQAAGILLVELFKQDKDIFHKIIEYDSNFTPDILWTFWRIGANQLEPKLLLLRSSRGLDKLLSLPIDLQKKYLANPVKVVVGIKDGKVITSERMVQDMDKKSLAVLFNGVKPRSIIDQVDVFRVVFNHSDTGTRLNKPSISPAQPTNRSSQPASDSADYKIIRYGVFDLLMDAGKIVLFPHTGPVSAQTVQVPISKKHDGRWGTTIELIEMKKK
jgi:hypothetical protein